MRKILLFIISCLVLTYGSDAAVRDGSVAIRAKNGNTARATTQRLKSTTVQERNTSPRTTAARTSTTPRATTTPSKTTKQTTRTAARTPAYGHSTPTTNTNIISRAADSKKTTSAISETRTGAEYERCKKAYFTCMDQFCSLKDDDYRRCSCSNRIYDFDETRDTMNQASEKLTVFKENLNAVGLTAEQATAMKTESDGEAALTADKSASKALLQAIMNSISGKDTNVGGKFSDLNSINLSFDTTNAFGASDSGQLIAQYNGQNLYNAVYPQCRNAVRADCNDASLQRAITAYLMAIENDCSAVQTAIENSNKKLKTAIREGSAMLDLARVENRQKHNSDDIATCISNVEAAILSDQVCGKGYKKCLDNGEYIDINTGNAIAGVVDFYKLKELLTFSDGKSIDEQKLSKINANRTFVSNFEARTKKFASAALDKCRENADVVWAEYLDKAMLDIYYAQKDKVAEIQQGCFDFVATCYMDVEKSISNAMQELSGTSDLILQPDKLSLSGALCTDYVNSCNKMFGNDIIKQYVENRQETDTITACRAVVKQCFDSFGGTNYENFYYPYSGLFKAGNALDWFTLYESDTAQDSTEKGNLTVKNWGKNKAHYKSTCAKQLLDIAACSSQEIIEAAFGGFDKAAFTTELSNQSNCKYTLSSTQSEDKYGTIYTSKIADDHSCLSFGQPRPSGVATEVYNQVLDILTTQCTNMQGLLLEPHFTSLEKYSQNNLCQIDFTKFSGNDNTDTSTTNTDQLAEFLATHYGFNTEKPEDMCPRNYGLSVDIESWGICSCWENGGRRSQNGQSTKCVAEIPISSDGTCPSSSSSSKDFTVEFSENPTWCPALFMSRYNQVCPLSNPKDNDTYDATKCGDIMEESYKNQFPKGLEL